MADETTPNAPQEGFLHSIATSLGIDPEHVKSTAKAILANPAAASKEIGSEAYSEVADAAARPLETAKEAGKGVLASITNPEAQEAAKARFQQPGISNKLAGIGEYLTSGVPLIGGNIVKAEEQATQKNLLGSLGTTIGTIAPMLTGAESPLPERPEGSAFFANPEAGKLGVGGSPKDIVEGQGLVYKGELAKGSGVHMFEHPDYPGKTAALYEPLTDEAVRTKMASKLKEFEKGQDLPDDLRIAQKKAPAAETAPDHITFEELGGTEVRAPQGKQLSGETHNFHVTSSEDRAANIRENGIKPNSWFVKNPEDMSKAGVAPATGNRADLRYFAVPKEDVTPMERAPEDIGHDDPRYVQSSAHHPPETVTEIDAQGRPLGNRPDATPPEPGMRSVKK